MKLNQFTDLGLRTLIYLTQPNRETPFTIGEMASELNVSANHLVKVVHFLARQGWVNTTRGRNGGIILAKDMLEYQLGTVIRILEERADNSNELVNCHSPECVLIRHCQLKSLLHSAMLNFFEYLNQYTLADAVNNPQSLSALWRIDSLDFPGRSL
ncbi:Rrf2 family transcriptional regulator [Rouxiella sp. WC2420]|uniref:Rrf2 family transcriptional regulator n=1 Tax=Rouxiella sp. WC2420 TaxID=3234145 RepID=A0AB39VTC0_9GAMM